MSVTQILEARPNLAVIEIHPPSLDRLRIAEQFHLAAAIPSLLIAADSRAVPLERLAADHIIGLLTWPVRLGDLGAAIALGLWRFHRLKAALHTTALSGQPPHNHNPARGMQMQETEQSRGTERPRSRE